MFSKTLQCAGLALIVFVGLALAVDLTYSEITIVKDSTRYTTLNPDVELVAFNKVYHVKGNYVFTAGDRISGDRLLVNYLDQTQFTKAEDLEVYLMYPAKGQNGATLTAVEIYVDLSSEKADVFFTNGGIDQRYAEILLTCNQTTHYTYETFIYGY